MPKIDRTVSPRAGLPSWAKCYCVSRHMPVYFRPFEWALPDGRALYLCPATYRGAKTLIAIYEQLEKPPSLKVQAQFTLFIRRLVKLHWRLKLAGDQEYRQMTEHNDRVISDLAREQEIIDLMKYLQSRADGEWNDDE